MHVRVRFSSSSSSGCQHLNFCHELLLPWGLYIDHDGTDGLDGCTVEQASSTWRMMMYLNRDMDGGPFLVYFLSILGGRHLLIYVLFPSHSWWAENCSVKLSRGMVCSSWFISFSLSFNICFIFFPFYSWWAKSRIVRLSKGMVCSRQPRSLQGVNSHGRLNEWTEDGWRDGWRDARI